MTAYEKYQLQWMIDHKYSLKNLMDELTEYQKDTDDEPAATVSDIFHAWEKDSGFCGELWVCEQEWQECEKSDTKFGRWIKSSYNTVYCSICDELAIRDSDEGYLETRHCPNCGAEMEMKKR